MGKRRWLSLRTTAKLDMSVNSKAVQGLYYSQA
jgi:hypothetical protein